MMHKIFLLLTFSTSLFLASCDQDEDVRTPEEKQIEKIKAIGDLLQYNTWGFDDLIIQVNSEMRAIPLLANLADENGMVAPGTYNSIDIYGNDLRQRIYSYQFINNKIFLDSTGQGEYNEYGSYLVLRSDEIGLTVDSSSLVRYKYAYMEEEGLFQMTSGQLGNAGINKAVNLLIAKSLISGKPGDIADLVVEKLLANENIQAAIQQLLYDLIHGNLDELAQNPEEVAQKLAELIVQKLKELDWETLVYDHVVAILEELKVDDPEQAAQELAEKIANRIETGISQSDIYEAILPILQNFENETLPKLVPLIAEAIIGVIDRAFSEENIFQIIHPIWTAFSEVDSGSITEISDSLGTVITDHFFDAETLSASLEPFIATLRSTSNAKIPALAQDIIDEVLIPLVDSINASFPGLELDPDWNSIKPVLVSVLTVIKTNIGDQTDAEAAEVLAGNIIGMMDLLISKGLETTLFRLQDIPADQASQVIAAWISKLVDMAGPQIVEYLETKLNELVDLFNAEEAAEELSTKIHERILELFSAGNIYEQILPVMERLSEINVEAAAGIITDWLFDLDLIEDGITEEQVEDAIAGIITELIGSINVDEASQKLVDLILQSEIVSNINGKVLKKLVEFKIYELLIALRNDLNAIDTIEISIMVK